MVGIANDDGGDIDLRSYLQVLRRRWITVLLCTVLIGGAAFALSARQPEIFAASSDILVRPSQVEGIVTESGAGNDRARDLSNEVRFAESDLVRDAVDEDYDGSLSADDVSISMSADTSDVLELRAQGEVPGDVAELVDTYATVLLEVRRQQQIDELLDAGSVIQARVDELAQRVSDTREPLTAAETALAADPENESLAAARDTVEQQLTATLTPLEGQLGFYQQQLESLQLTAGITSTTGAAVLSQAEVPSTPVSPQPLRDATVGIVLGLLIGVGLAFLRESLDERLRTVSDLERIAPGLPTLAVVPHADEATAPDYVATRDGARTVSAEAYRSLRTGVKFAAIDRSISVIEVTSSTTGDGKTTTVANLAVALAQGGDRVVVVCCDLRRPRVQERFHEALTPGFTDVILGDASIADALRLTDAGVYLLPAGTPPPNPSELLSSDGALAVIELLSEQFDTVVVDATPVLPVTDALVVSRFADATIFVVNGTKTRRNALKRSLQLLEQVQAPVLGFVLTGVDSSGGYGYGYGYSYEGYGEGGVSERGRAARKARRQAKKDAPPLDGRRNGSADGEDAPVASGARSTGRSADR